MKSVSTRIGALLLVLALALIMIPAAFAATADDAVIDFSKTGSIDIYKIDITNAERDGVWDSSYVSTGVRDEGGVEDILINTNRLGDDDSTSDLGNGQTSQGYAIKGVEFTYLKVADICTYSMSENGTEHVEVLYGIPATKAYAQFLSAIGVSADQRYVPADSLDASKQTYYFRSDVLIDGMAAALESNSTVVKNALESWIKENGGKAMPETDSYGHTSADKLPLGLYLFCETKCPEMVDSVVDPWLLSLPMTSKNGGNASDGGTRWIYNVTAYPKNLTGIPSLEKTLREDHDLSTGKNKGSQTDITDGYAHTGTASDGDTIDYQLISTLPSITSTATYLTCYTFVDTLSEGITYNRNDVKLEFFTADTCLEKDRIAAWTESDGKFTVSYNEMLNSMTIEMTAAGLLEINTSRAVYKESSMVNSGYSDCTLRITYAATMNSDASVSYGDDGNPNAVVLTWKRSNTSYYDTLVDDCHVYTYALDLTKQFSDGQGDFSKVSFNMYNTTDKYWVVAELNQTEGIYYVTGHAEKEEDATSFVPMANGANKGKVIIKGLEDDTYIITELTTDDGYTLLRDSITMTISQKASNTVCDIYDTDALGLLQNDPRYAKVVNGGNYHNIPQKHLEHTYLTASAAVDGNPVAMAEDYGSENAAAQLTVVNTKGFELPETGDTGTYLFTVVGVLGMTAAAVILLMAAKRKEQKQ